MQLDIPTIISVTSVIFVAQTIAVYAQYRINRTFGGLGWWFAGAVLHAAGFLLMLALRSPALRALALFAVPLVVAGELALKVGIERFLGIPSRLKTQGAILAAFVVAYYFFIFGMNSISGRSVVVSGATALIGFRIALTLLRRRRPQFARSALFLASVFLAYAAFHAAIVAKTLVSGPIPSYQEFGRESVRIALFMVPIVCSVLWTAGFIIMVNQRLISAIREEREKLETAEREIRKLLAEKELILQEVHHRIKNNLGTVSSLLSLQAGLSRDPATIAALSDAGNRIRSMTTLYEELYRSTNFTDLSVKEYLPPLVDEILSNFPNAANVAVEKRVDDFVLEVRSLQPLGIIVNELLTNTMKYAFSGNGAGTISVSATRSGGVVTVSVADDGAGIPPSVDFGESGGFGLTVVDALAKQLHGSVRIERGRGTRVVLEFPG